MIKSLVEKKIIVKSTKKTRLKNLKKLFVRFMSNKSVSVDKYDEGANTEENKLSI